jgi:hypothetical protein
VLTAAYSGAVHRSQTDIRLSEEAPMNTNMLYMEHRWGTRVDLFTPAAVVTPSGRSFKALVRNASLSGAFVETFVRLVPLSRIVLKPAVPGADWMEACVVRNEPRGVGVEWLEPALRSVSALLASRDDAQEFDVAPRLQRHSVSWQLLDRLHLAGLERRGGASLLEEVRAARQPEGEGRYPGSLTRRSSSTRSDAVGALSVGAASRVDCSIGTRSCADCGLPVRNPCP